MSGRIELYLGCMFSGKSTEAQNQYREWGIIGKKVICINHESDKRYGETDYMSTHNGSSIPCVSCSSLADISKDVEKYDVVIVNEGQFFHDVVNYCVKWCDELGKIVIVSALDGDFKREPIGEILKLIPHADHYVKLKSRCFYCRDGTEAVFSLRTVDIKDQIYVSAAEYKPVCRKHYLEKCNSSI